MSSDRGYLRFRTSQRIEHWLLVITFVVLAVTGLAQKFAQNGLAIWLIGILGGIETVRVIHRVAATVLMVEAIYHIGTIGYQIFVNRTRPGLMPGWRDLVNGIQLFLYNLGLRSERPKQDRFTAEEKLEYFSLVWGTAVMIVTGFMLWNPIATTSQLPGEVIPTAKAVHGGEALLAVLAILLWHLYHVHVRHLNRSMFTGYLSQEEMEDEHPLELARLEAGDAPTQPDAGLARRRRVFRIVYGVFAAVLLIGVYIFISFEQTAIETVPSAAQQVALFAHIPPTAEPTGEVTVAARLTSWDGGIGALFQTKCSFCHGGIVPLAGLDLTSYDDAMLSKTEAPAIVPSDALGSGIIIWQQKGDHPVEFTPLELAEIYDWIERGAPQTNQEG